MRKTNIDKRRNIFTKFSSSIERLPYVHLLVALPQKIICVVQVTKIWIYFCFPVLHTTAENGGQGWRLYWNQNYAAYWNGVDGSIWLNTVTSGVLSEYDNEPSWFLDRREIYR
jgi:hypothetical protein